jgi:beta-fructofuranosidase
MDYEKYEGNPVIGADLIPEGGSVKDFRDPKIWMEGGKYNAVIVNEGPDGSGRVLLYESEDAIHWNFVSIIASCHNQYGRMWECPDFFPLDGRHVLLVSPIEMSAIGLEFHPGNATVCMIGTYDRQKKHLLREAVHAIDYGLDFYAPQTLKAADGRRIMIAWMQNWETSACRQHDLSFMGQMTIPRELSVKNGRLYQLPVRELENYRGIRVEYSNILVNGDLGLSGISGRYVDMTVSIRPVNVSNLYKWFRIYVAKDGEHYTLIRFRPDVGTVKVDRTHSGFPHDIVNIREFPVNAVNGMIKFRIILDRYSLELFVNDGEQAASFVLYTPAEAGAITFSSDGNVIADIVKYELKMEDAEE